jgi:hypothetical protein
MKFYFDFLLHVSGVCITFTEILFLCCSAVKLISLRVVYCHLTL